jgi:drug/metabolite transporter (DMT)-like permease
MSPTPSAAWRAQFVLLAAIWGSSFACIKVLGEEWPAVHVALGRIALGALTLLVVLAVRRERLPRDGRLWLHLAVVGLLMNAAPFVLFAYGEHSVTSIVGGLWNATVPLTTLVAVLAFLPEERPDRRRLAGLALGFGGVILLLGPWRGLGGDALLGHLACFVAAGCYGLGATYTRRHLAGARSRASRSPARSCCAPPRCSSSWRRWPSRPGSRASARRRSRPCSCWASSAAASRTC